VTYRLPTEEEWEFAARNGGEFLSYPWGNTWQDRRAVVYRDWFEPTLKHPNFGFRLVRAE
jgi:formylglycine-generating enzyme required for sulfatase activity